MGKGSAQLGKSLKGAGTALSGPADNQVDEDVLDDAAAETYEVFTTFEAYERAALLRRQHVASMMGRATTFRKGEMVHRKRLVSKWQAMMRKQSTRELRDDVTFRVLDFERGLNITSGRKQNCFEEHVELDQAKLRSVCDASMQIQKLVNLQALKLNALTNLWEESLHKVQKEFKEEFSAMKSRHSGLKMKLNDLLGELRYEKEQAENYEMQTVVGLREGIRNRNLETINSLRLTLDRVIEEIEKRFDVAHKHYFDNTNERTKDFELLAARDRDLSMDIDHKIRLIESCQVDLISWRKKLMENGRECRSRNRRVRIEKESIADAYYVLKQRMNSFRNSQRNRLKAVSAAARTARLKNEGRHELACNILRLAERAIVNEEKYENVGLSRHDETIEEEQDQEMQDLLETSKHLEINIGSFQRKFNMALYSRALVRQQRDSCREENTRLKEVLKAYLGAINVAPDVLERENTLLIVNGKHNLSRRSFQPARIPLLEANMIVDTYALQGLRQH